MKRVCLILLLTLAGSVHLVSRTGPVDEGSLGHKSSGVERFVLTPCP